MLHPKVKTFMLYAWQDDSTFSDFGHLRSFEEECLTADGSEIFVVLISAYII